MTTCIAKNINLPIINKKIVYKSQHFSNKRGRFMVKKFAFSLKKGWFGGKKERKKGVFVANFDIECGYRGYLIFIT
jgi:hypothetical protein